MLLRATVHYDADPARVAAMLADEGFVAARVAATGALAHDVAVVGAPPGAFTVTTRRQVATTGIPAQFRTLVGSSLQVREVEAWEPADEEGRVGTLVAEIVGAPVRLTGTLRLTRDAAGGTTLDVEADLRATVPIVGAAIEQSASRSAALIVAAEERAGADWLGRADA